MKRFLFWYLPLGVALVFSAAFAYGFLQVFRSDKGRGVTAPVEQRKGDADQKALDIVILGDSLAKGTGDETGLGIGGSIDSVLKQKGVPHRKPVNLAVNGAKTPDLLRLLEAGNVKVILSDAEVIVISIGGNDLFGAAGREGAPPRDADVVMNGVLDRIGQIVGLVREANPGARIYLVGLYNPFVASPFGPALSASVNRWNSRLAEKFVSDIRFTVVSTNDLVSRADRLSADGFHPGAEVYASIGRRVAEGL